MRRTSAASKASAHSFATPGHLLQLYESPHEYTERLVTWLDDKPLLRDYLARPATGEALAEFRATLTG